MAPAQKHRESLINASIALFQRQGYAGTGLAEILAESGAPKGSLYHYFPDGKEAVGEAAMAAAALATEQRIRDAAARLKHPRQVVLAYGEALSQLLERSNFSLGCSVATVALESWPSSPRITAATDAAFRLWIAALADMLRGAGIATARADALGAFMLATLEGALILARVRQSTQPVLSAAAELANVFDQELKSLGDEK